MPESINYVEEETRKYLCFGIDDEVYGVEVDFVNEIISYQTFTVVPKQPDYMKGIINLRGKIIPVIDIRIRFNKEERAYDERTCVIVVELKDEYIGIIVDRVNEVLDIGGGSISSPPIRHKKRNEFVNGISQHEETNILLLDIQKLLHELRARDQEED